MTDFTGQVQVAPPLNPAEIAYLRKFAGSRRMHREQGPYWAEPGDSFGQSDRQGVINRNQPPPEQPALWCKWVPAEDGTVIEWDQREKFYHSAEWMVYLIKTFLMPGAAVQCELTSPVPGREYPAEFAAFTFDHACDGVIEAQGDDDDDRWDLVVRANTVATRAYALEAGEEIPV